ncbi:hypothetical protein CT19425_U300001 [Cupriavidus taiwanensis]|uniref:Uncharacterized protein n=1 Tax=Cupriavidus taiwanensis TaxID=164546 RepID=A0A375I9R6_9BURK|nr:hypothetical protein CT19425_U300001 [Cupriavidus taiwanensis]
MLGLTFILPAIRIALLVGGTTVLLRLPGVLTRFLANVAAGSALLRLLCRPCGAGKRDAANYQCRN